MRYPTVVLSSTLSTTQCAASADERNLLVLFACPRDDKGAVLGVLFRFQNKISYQYFFSRQIIPENS